MPAGVYTIRTLPTGASHVFLFDNETAKMQAIVLVRTSNATPPKAVTPLTFISGAGERAELANIAIDGWTYELSVHPAPKPLKGAALAITSAGK